VQRCQVEATLIITTTLSYSSYFTYFLLSLHFLLLGAKRNWKKISCEKVISKLRYYKSLHNIKIRTTESRKKSSCKANRRLDRKVFIRLPIKAGFVPTKDFASRNFHHYCYHHHHHHHWGGVIICVLEKQSLMKTIVFTPYYRWLNGAVVER
jgi:hypothetical protein